MIEFIDVVFCKWLLIFVILVEFCDVLLYFFKEFFDVDEIVVFYVFYLW